ncbi:MAG: hypothetical protein HY777_04035 [Betaproteobacteria bacterium]|nr:hypothetical protein [Betaproteobacteria bacterium]
MTEIKLFQIFRTGTFTAMNGLTREYSEEDVNLMAAAYKPEIRPAPLVLGHPKDQDAEPHMGRVESLIFKNNVLFALATFADSLVDLIRAGSYRHVSAAFSLPDSPDNPTPGAFYLRHVAFLGAMPPAVKGLVPPSFSDGSGLVSFSSEIPGAFINADDFNLPIGYTVGDAHRLALHRAALQIQRDCPAVSYCEAVKLVDGVVAL